MREVDKSLGRELRSYDMPLRLLSSRRKKSKTTSKETIHKTESNVQQMDSIPFHSYSQSIENACKNWKKCSSSRAAHINVVTFMQHCA